MQPQRASASLSDGGTTSTRNSEVIQINRSEPTFWAQLVGSVNVGFSYTGGSSATELNLAGDVAYRTEHWGAKLDGSSVLNRQEGAEDSGRNTLMLNCYHYRGQRWFFSGTTGFLNSQQQDLTLRSTLGAGIGVDLVQRARTSLKILGGTLFANEQYSFASGAASVRGADSQSRL